MSREFSVIIERDEEGYYVASVPALPGCHTQAKSLDELMERVREAIALCLEVETEAAGRPEVVGVQRVTVPVAKLVSERPKPKPGLRPPPGLGKGVITVVSDDDEHLQDFAEYMP